jgi:hypothetical protein
LWWGVERLIIISRIFEVYATLSLEFFMIPFCDFGVGKDRVLAAGDAGRETTGYIMIGGIVSFTVSSRIVFTFPVAVLS